MIQQSSRSEPRRRRLCSAITANGTPCKAPALVGLKVCRSHGGGTTAASKKSRKAKAKAVALKLWSLSCDKNIDVDITKELKRLAKHKLTDITALRLELGANPEKYYGMLANSYEVSDSEGGTKQTRKHKAGVHPLVIELHKAEAELVQILRLLQEVTGGTDAGDLLRLRAQSARRAAQILKAHPGISVDNVAREVSREN